MNSDVNNVSNKTVSILAELPVGLHDSLEDFLKNKPDWDQDRVVSAAIALFLLQNQAEKGDENIAHRRNTARVYLDSIFRTEPTTERND